MKTIFAVLLALCLSCEAGYEVVTLGSVRVAPTNSVSITNTLPAGKLVAASMDSSGGAFTGLVVTAQSGFSPSARTLIGEVVVQPEGNITNFAATIYVAGDTVVFTAFNAATTASVTAVAHVIVDR